MATEKTELECGCEILVYGDGSASPEVVYCDDHDAKRLADALDRIKHLESGIEDLKAAMDEVQAVAKSAYRDAERLLG